MPLVYLRANVCFCLVAQKARKLPVRGLAHLVLNLKNSFSVGPDLKPILCSRDRL